MTKSSGYISKMYRQGDLLFKKVLELPSNLRKKRNGIIAEGEISGHAHIIVNGAIYETINKQNNRIYVKAVKNTKIVHDEHQSIKLPTGLYQVIRQREYLSYGVNKVVED